MINCVLDPRLQEQTAENLHLPAVFLTHSFWDEIESVCTTSVQLRLLTYAVYVLIFLSAYICPLYQFNCMQSCCVVEQASLPNSHSQNGRRLTCDIYTNILIPS